MIPRMFWIKFDVALAFASFLVLPPRPASAQLQPLPHRPIYLLTMNVFSTSNAAPSYNDFTAHFRHPWIAKPCMKRQHSSSPSDSESSDERQVKRRRFTNFERGFSRLSLADPLRNTSPSVASSSAHSNEPDITEIQLPHTDVPIASDGTTPMELDTPGTEVPSASFPTPIPSPVPTYTVKPSSVEEPGSKSPSTSPPAPDIHMKGMHSYEPERDREYPHDRTLAAYTHPFSRCHHHRP